MSTSPTDVAEERRARSGRSMPSGSSLISRSSGPASSSHSVSGTSSTRLWSENSYVSRPSPYGSDRQVRKLVRKDNREVGARSEDSSNQDHGDSSISLAGRRAIMCIARKDFISMCSITNIWQSHCTERTARAREALLQTIRTSLEVGEWVPNSRSISKVSQLIYISSSVHQYCYRCLILLQPGADLQRARYETGCTGGCKFRSRHSSCHRMNANGSSGRRWQMHWRRRTS